MFKLRYGLLICCILTGIVLAYNYLSSLPDGKMHVYVCDVGQGDGTYIRLPRGEDIIVDGGPNENMIRCLGQYMPFWDRTIDAVILTHPQSDHMQGLFSVFQRYKVDTFIHSDIQNNTDGYKKLLRFIRDHQVKQKLVTAGQVLTAGDVVLRVVWPTASQIARMKPVGGESDILGAASAGDLNDGSVVFFLTYGSFDMLFPGDADSRVDEKLLETSRIFRKPIEAVKVPHHGSKASMSDAYLQFVSAKGMPRKKVAIVSVGKNTFGHPDGTILNRLKHHGFTVWRTDESGDIEIVTNGIIWSIIGHRTRSRGE